jgi:hypothetical protein
MLTRPTFDECVGFHRDYVAGVPDGNILKTLETQIEKIQSRIRSIPSKQAETIHPPYGWTVRQVIEHCVNAERVFGYRAMRFAAGDTTDLPGWDEDHYAECGFGMHCSVDDLCVEFVALRRANIALLGRLTESAWDATGTAEGRKMSVRTLAWLMAGHWLHHDRILTKRLGS